jgi:putative FmdB family regulatory protein
LPIYEYICMDCRKRSTILFLSSSAGQAVKCSYCGSVNLQRIMSRFAAPKSEESRMEALADPSSWSGLDENNPASVAKFVKKMGSALGDEVSRDDLDQMADDAAQETDENKD